MKRSIQEISMGGGTFDEPERGGGRPPQNKWAGRMKWKPSGNPLLHPDEEAALAGQQQGAPEPPGPTPDDLLDAPPAAADAAAEPGAGLEVPIRQHLPFQKARFNLPRPEMEPMRFAGAADIDALMAEIKAEEAKPPHQQNAAKLTRLKADAMELMSQEESRQVQRMADRLLPRLEG